jgi:uncharacterized membrane protein (DUF373 family)
MKQWKKWLQVLKVATSEENFLVQLERIEVIVSKILSLFMLVVIAVSIWHLGLDLFQFLFLETEDSFTKILFSIFGLFLNVLIALEILENITAYLKKHVIQLELVIVTSLIAVARKIIILDLEKTTELGIIALATAILALSISYWVIRNVNSKEHK